MKKILIFGGIGLVVVIAIVVVLFLFVFNGDGEPDPVVELKYQFEEQYTNIPVGDEEGSYKILKLQMTVVYTDEDFTTDVFPLKEDEVIDFLNGYFRDTTVATVNRTNGKERIKEEITEELRELLETDEENILGVLFTQFIIQ